MTQQGMQSADSTIQEAAHTLRMNDALLSGSPRSRLQGSNRMRDYLAPLPIATAPRQQHEARISRLQPWTIHAIQSDPLATENKDLKNELKSLRRMYEFLWYECASVKRSHIAISEKVVNLNAVMSDLTRIKEDNKSIVQETKRLQYQFVASEAVRKGLHWQLERQQSMAHPERRAVARYERLWRKNGLRKQVVALQAIIDTYAERERAEAERLTTPDLLGTTQVQGYASASLSDLIFESRLAQGAPSPSSSNGSSVSKAEMALQRIEELHEAHENLVRASDLLVQSKETHKQSEENTRELEAARAALYTSQERLRHWNRTNTVQQHTQLVNKAHEQVIEAQLAMATGRAAHERLRTVMGAAYKRRLAAEPNGAVEGDWEWLQEIENIKELVRTAEERQRKIDAERQEWPQSRGSLNPNNDLGRQPDSLTSSSPSSATAYKGSSRYPLVQLPHQQVLPGRARSTGSTEIAYSVLRLERIKDASLRNADAMMATMIDQFDYVRMKLTGLANHALQHTGLASTKSDTSSSSNT